MPPGMGVQLSDRDRLHDVSNVSQWIWKVKSLPARLMQPRWRAHGSRAEKAQETQKKGRGKTVARPAGTDSEDFFTADGEDGHG